MKRIDESEAILRLMKAKIGSRVRVRYLTFTPPSPRALEESQTAQERGLDLQVFVGSLEGVGMNKQGRFFFTLFTPDRDTIEGNGVRRRGNYRSFNPSKGALFGLRVLDRL